MTAPRTVYDWHATPARGGPPAGRPRQRLSPAFAMAESERAGKQAARREEAFVRRIPPFVLDDDEVVPYDDPPWVPYPQLDEDTLTREFEPLEPLPEMTP